MEIDVDDERFMARAVELARVPEFTSPNPRVGAVFVKDGTIVASGAYEGPGSPHAEAAALAAIEEAAGATCYVTLEPCAHHGRTPPCAHALVDAGVSRVVAAIEDPDHRVSGRGIAYLRTHGVQVDVGVGASEARAMNAAYLYQRTTGRPLVTVKLALTLDGRLAAPDGSSVWITGEEARTEVHRRRREVDAVMVGAGTVAADDPSLTVRNVPASRQPAAVIVDSSGRTDPGASIFTTGAQVIVATTESSSHERQTAWKEAGAEVLVLPARDGSVDLAALRDELSRRGWIEIMCEGGAELATSLLKADLAARLEIYLGAVVVGRGGPDIGDLGIASLASAPRFELVSHDRFGDDIRVTYMRSED